MDIKKCLHLFMSIKYNLQVYNKYNLQVVNYFDLVDISTCNGCGWSVRSIYGIVRVSFNYNYITLIIDIIK